MIFISYREYRHSFFVPQRLSGKFISSLFRDFRVVSPTLSGTLKNRRHADDSTNSALNYGYTILTTMMTRLLVLHGYNTALGIHHCNPTNPFNLCCDLVEPFRPFVDAIAYANTDRELDWEYKKEYVSLLQTSCCYKGNGMKLESAMGMFLLDIMKMMHNTNNIPGEVDFG